MDLLVNQSSPIQILKKPPFPTYCFSTPQYHYDNGNFVLIIGRDAIYKYNLDEQIIAEKYEFPLAAPNTDQIGHFDPKTGIFYVIDEYTYWMTFDLNTKQWDTSFFREPIENYSVAPIDQLHFIQNDSHYVILDDDEDFAQNVVSNIAVKNKCIRDDDGLSGTYYYSPKFVYNSNDNQLMMFQCKSRRILMCKIYDQNQKSYKWKKSKIKLKHKLPGRQREFEVVLGWNQILFVFNLENWFIECVDLKHPEIGPYTQKIDKDLLLKRGLIFEYAVKDNNNDLHVLKLNVKNGDEPKLCHFKISLLDLIPSAVLERNQKDWEMVVIGYCKQCEKQKKMTFIPDTLTNLILQFYPIFV